MARLSAVLERRSGAGFLRVAIVCPYAWDAPGGVQSHVRAQAAALRRRGHEVRVVAPGRGPAVDPGVVLTGGAIPVPANGSTARLAFGPRAARRVRAALHDFAPDVVHVHEPLIPSISLLAVRTAPAPVVATFHAARPRSAGYALARRLLRGVDGRISLRVVVSEAAHALVGRYFPGDYEKIPNGVDAGRFATAAPADLGPGPSVLFVGRLERRKGLEVFLQAAARAAPRPRTIAVVGRGPHVGRGRRLARGLGLEVAWLGRVDEELLPGIVAGADAFCAPSLGGESFGIVLLEAMAAGAPVVCSSLPGYVEAAGDAALLVPAGDAGAVADALGRIWSDPALAQRLRDAGRARAAALDWDALVARLEEVYGRALSGAG